MSVAEFREACGLLLRMPVLWIPGVVGGLCAAFIWLLFILSGAFFAGRFVVIAGLIVLFFIAGMLAVIRQNEGSMGTLAGGGRQYFFRVLLPLLVVLFMILLVFVLVMLTLTLIGIPSDPALLVFLSFGVAIPSILMTLFSDTAAVFEDRKVFESIQRSIDIVSQNTGKVISFVLISALAGAAILFSLMIVWEALLFDKLEPLTHYTEEQLKTFTPDQLLTMIGSDGTWVTAVVIFLAGLLLIPLLMSYKACTFRKLAGSTVLIQQVTGEYDSKGRWYKY
ncbi:DUF7847 domain-containing protein [Methanoregula formicica]|uniref:Uncharacterized protein n=1 Tax=Methanoregula formicica (strain DSM 22288 / NBRC 105244 / SMSP) TaxID=593750 RepID=L0HC60_METFS|nr:hypothetical protein [Methanoregula formicica]AGB02322.1 hypothetical protein Metfor_1280 [Methanoregula formicica SMSP]